MRVPVTTPVLSADQKELFCLVMMLNRDTRQLGRAAEHTEHGTWVQHWRQASVGPRVTGGEGPPGHPAKTGDPGDLQRRRA